MDHLTQANNGKIPVGAISDFVERALLSHLNFAETMDPEYMTAYEQECQDTMVEGIKYWRDKYEALLQAPSSRGPEYDKDAS